MAKAGIIVLADAESHESLGRVLNALMVARELKDAGDDVIVTFDGGGTAGALKFADPDHDANSLFESLREQIAGACKYCAGAFEVADQLEEKDVTLIDEYKGHPSVKSLVDDGYEIITF